MLCSAAALLALAGALTACSGKEQTGATTTTTSTAPVETTSTTEVPMTAGKEMFVWLPEPGDCFDKRKPDPKKNDEVVLKLDCNLPHSNEIFGSVELPKDFPGDVLMKELGMKECPKQFKAFVGAPYETSKYQIGYQLPTLATWPQGSRHVIGCYLFEQGKKLEGSKRGVKE